MAFRMRSLSSSRKAQFFVLSTLIIVVLMYLMGRWISSSTVPDASAVAVNAAPFIFNNIVEKTQQTVKASGDCQTLTYNIQEYSAFVKNFAAGNGYNLYYNYNINPSCSIGAGSRTVTFNISLSTASAFLSKNITMAWP